MVNKGGRPPSKEPRSGPGGRADSTDTNHSGGRNAAGKAANSSLQPKKNNGLRRAPETPDSKPLRNLKASEGGGMGKKSDAVGKKHGSVRPSHPNKAPSPAEPTIIRAHTHWDYVMMEMKWMAVDFMQERRWKMAMSAYSAHWAAKTVQANAPEQKDAGAVTNGMETIHAQSSTSAEMPSTTAEGEAAGWGSDPLAGDAGDREGAAAGGKDDKPEADGGAEASGKKQAEAATKPLANGDVLGMKAEPSGPAADSNGDEAKCHDKGELSEHGREREDTGPSGKEIWSAGCLDWNLVYRSLPDLTQLLKVKIAEIDDRRALMQDLKVFEYQLDYDAACASVALAHQVAKEDAARQAAAQEARLAEAHIAAEEDSRRNKRLKKKTSKTDMELDEETDLQNKKPMVSVSLIHGAKPPRPQQAGVPGAAQQGLGVKLEGGLTQEGSADFGKRKSDKKRRKGSETGPDGFGVFGEAMDVDGAKPMKRTNSSLEATGKGKPSKKSKTAKTPGGPDPGSDTGQAIAAQRGKKVMIAGDMIEWTAQEDQLLCAIVHEFGQNWALVADVFSKASPVPGVYRKSEHCKLRHRTLTTPRQDGSLEPVVHQLRTVRGASREVLTNAIPIQESVLAHQLGVLSKVSQTLMMTLAEDKKRKVEVNQLRHMMHASHAAVEMKCLQAHNGKHLSALELIDITNQPVATLPTQVFQQPQQLQLPQQHQQQQQAQARPGSAVLPGITALQQPQQPAAAAGAVAANLPGVATTQHLATSAGQAHHTLPGVASSQPNGVVGTSQAGFVQGAAGILAASTQGQALPGGQAGVVVQGTQQGVLPANLQTSAAFQAALQRQQQQVAQIAQAKQLTPQQQQQLLARLQAQAMAQQQALQTSQAFSTGMMAAAQQQQPQQLMQGGVASQPGMAVAHSSPQQMLLPGQQGLVQGASPPLTSAGVQPQLQQLQQQQMAGLQQQQQQAAAAVALQQQQQQALMQQQGMQPMASQGLLIQQGMQLPGQQALSVGASQAPQVAASQPNPPAM
mmetsp:Transcript_39746/g.112786  ORF Transcript_39746/g.112786 Transcript_39746/m.112786 type:complete len:1021 (+) Transcript_39746:660-3722(+)|eukprot:CAMPEP_0117678168 /NCGR_PEP_ID=MMETSP0804-20121206/17145_1 /TAXON_ID=1074897 /ORGANISM="Tetraselmis astigmatica, Strain CCMP880" /LENGTH=1020 /DNA_ID=CAMNT_0005487521 /DNA_START=517 /DNA_END=3579 /DNA_ORIENTATION=+